MESEQFVKTTLVRYIVNSCSVEAELITWPRPDGVDFLQEISICCGFNQCSLSIKERLYHNITSPDLISADLN